jgi:hypothetical protein
MRGAKEFFPFPNLFSFHSSREFHSRTFFFAQKNIQVCFKKNIFTITPEREKYIELIHGDDVDE